MLKHFLVRSLSNASAFTAVLTAVINLGNSTLPGASIISIVILGLSVAAPGSGFAGFGCFVDPSSGFLFFCESGTVAFIIFFFG